MNLAIFGITGGTGRQLLLQALAGGHQIAALVRRSSGIDSASGLRVIEGNVLDPEPVAATVNHADAVICLLGQTPGNQADIVSKGTVNIIKAMQDAGVSRLVAVTSMGVGDSAQQVSERFRRFIAQHMREIMDDKERQEKLITLSDLAWTIIRPGGLTNGPLSGCYQFGTDQQTIAGSVSRADVADFIMKQLTGGEFLHEAVWVT